MTTTTPPMPTPMPIAEPVGSEAGGDVELAPAVVVGASDVVDTSGAVELDGASGLVLVVVLPTRHTPRPPSQQAVFLRPQHRLPSAQKVISMSVSRSLPSAANQSRGPYVSASARGTPAACLPTHICTQPGARHVGSVHDSRQTMLVSCVSWHRPSDRHTSGNEAAVSLVRQHMLPPVPARVLHAAYRASAADPSGR